MNFAQYLPTSLQGLMPDGTGSDPNQLPQDDTMMQLELKRKFALADALKGQAMPEGQMVSGHYVAPSWTQYLANAVGKYQGARGEQEAIKQYGDYRTAENTRMAEALGKFGKAFEPTTTTNTTYAPGVGKELAVGDTVQTAPNYSPTSNANEMVAPTSPYGTQSMMGNATTSVPTTTTSTVQPTAGSINQAFTDYAAATRNPKLAEQLMMSRFTDYQKRNDPFKLSKDETLFGRDANGNLVKLATNPGENTQFGKINPSEYTPASVATFMQTGKQSDLVSAKPAVVPTTRNMRQGNQDITQQWNPSTNSWQTIATGNAFKPDEGTQKPPAGYAWGKDGSLVAIKGGPADKAANLTESQANANLFGSRAKASHNILNGLEGKYNPALIQAQESGAGNLPGVGYVLNKFADQNTQSAAQAQRDFVNAVLRKESGASISSSEFDQARKQYFPQPGDTPETIKQKRDNRAIAIKGIETAAGPANKQTTVDFNDLH